MVRLKPQDFGTPKQRSVTMIDVEIDGMPVRVPAGTSVLRAAAEIGIDIPKLCATDNQEPFGSCRLCLVEIKGRQGYPASCTTEVEPGMQIKTQTDPLATLRRGIMELYISDHPLDCLTCHANGDCDLQDMAGVVGLREVRYPATDAHHIDAPADSSNPYFTFDPSLCIVCSRCVQACDDLQETFALTVENRGFDSKIAASQGESFLDSECVACGACVDTCPTGALIEKTVIEAGVPERAVATTCAYCGVGCALQVEMQGDQVVRVTPAKDGKANHGHACVKGRFAWGFVTHPDRITTPMIRRSIEDPWREASWVEAIGHVASEFKRIARQYGSNAVGAITSSRCTNEETYLMQKFVRAALGNNNIDNCARVCHAPTGYGLKATLGGSAGTQHFDSVRDADVIMVVGANPTDSHPVFGSMVKRRVRAGAKLIVIDPRRTGLVKSPHVSAAYHLALQPGANLLVLNGLAHAIISEGLVDEDFVAGRCEPDAYEQWRAFVLRDENAPEAVADLSGVSADDIRGAARLYATGGNAAIYYGLGVTEHSQGSTAVMALANLAMLTGNFGRAGVGVNPMRGQNNVQGACDMGCFPEVFPGYRSVTDEATRSLFERVWGVSLDPEPGLRIPGMIDAAVEDSFKGVIIQGEDIAQSDPNVQHVEAGLKAMECVVIQDLFLNETANYAHVFLPGASFLEKNGTFTNAERRISRVRRTMPPRAGMAEWEVTIALSRAMGFDMDYSHPSEIMDEIARLTPSFAGVSYDLIDRLGSVQWPCHGDAPEGTEIMHQGQFTRGLGRFMITEYFPTEERTTERHPLRLTTGRILSQYNVGVQTRRTGNVVWHEEDVLEIHPLDAEERGIHNGDLVALESRSGEIALRADISERVAPGVVYTTFHHPETGLNVVTTDYADWATDCPEYKVTAVQVRRAARPSDWQEEHVETERLGHRISYSQEARE